MRETVSFIVHLPAKPEHREELLAALTPVLEQMAQEPDFVNTFLHHSQDDPDTFVLYETWACSREHFLSHHLARPYRKDYELTLQRLLREARRLEFLEPMRGFVGQEESRA